MAKSQLVRLLVAGFCFDLRGYHFAIADCCSHFDIGRHNNKRQVAYTEAEAEAEAEADPPIVVGAGAAVVTLPSIVGAGDDNTD